MYRVNGSSTLMAATTSLAADTMAMFVALMATPLCPAAAGEHWVIPASNPLPALSNNMSGLSDTQRVFTLVMDRIGEIATELRRAVGQILSSTAACANRIIDYHHEMYYKIVIGLEKLCLNCTPSPGL